MKITSRLILAEDKLRKGFQGVNLKIVLPSGEAKNNAVLGPLLGQHQINILSFCNEFNSKSSQLFEQGIYLPVQVGLKKDKSYTLNIRYPTVNTLIYQIMEDRQSISLSKLYDLVKILSFFFGRSERASAKQLFGYMSSSLFRNTINIK